MRSCLEGFFDGAWIMSSIDFKAFDLICGEIFSRSWKTTQFIASYQYSLVLGESLGEASTMLDTVFSVCKVSLGEISHP